MGRGRLVDWQWLDGESIHTNPKLLLMTCQVLLLPTIFEKLNERTLYIFGGVNVFSIIAVWALYPESNQRTLEEMNLLFASDSIWNWEAEKHYKILKEQNPELVQAAERGNSVVDEKGVPRRSSVARNMSLDINATEKEDAEKSTP